MSFACGLGSCYPKQRSTTDPSLAWGQGSCQSLSDRRLLSLPPSASLGFISQCLRFLVRFPPHPLAPTQKVPRPTSPFGARHTGRSVTLCLEPFLLQDSLVLSPFLSLRLGLSFCLSVSYHPPFLVSTPAPPPQHPCFLSSGLPTLYSLARKAQHLRPQGGWAVESRDEHTAGRDEGGGGGPAVWEEGGGTLRPPAPQRDFLTAPSSAHRLPSQHTSFPHCSMREVCVCVCVYACTGPEWTGHWRGLSLGMGAWRQGA